MHYSIDTKIFLGLQNSTRFQNPDFEYWIIQFKFQGTNKANPIVRIRSKSPHLMSPISLRANFDEDQMMEESADEELACEAVLDQSSRSIELNKVYFQRYNCIFYWLTECSNK